MLAGRDVNPILEGQTASIAFSVSAQDMLTFRQLSGDDNPMHSDAQLARSRNYAGPIVYGAVIIAQVSRLIGTRLPGSGCVWQSASINFRAPLYVGEAASVDGTVLYVNAELGVMVLGIEVMTTSRRVAEGKVQVLLPGTKTGNV